MPQLIAANNAQSTLAGSISNTATIANLASGSGTLFAPPSAGQYFVGTFTDAATGLLHEIVWVTNVTGDQITMQRAQEGTTGLNWSANDLFGNLMTAGQLETLVQLYQAQQQGFNYAVDSGAVNAYLIALSPTVGTAPTSGMPVRMVAANTNTGAATLDAGWGAVAVVRRNGSALIGGEIVANKIVELFWDGTVFEYIGLAPATAAAIVAGIDTQSAVTPAQLAAALGSQLLVSGQCFLGYTSPTLITLLPKNGDRVPVAGSLVALPSAGASAANTNITLNGTPASNLGASQVYLVAMGASGQLEYWTLSTGYTSDSTAGNIGVEVITGHPTKTLVGMVATNSSSQFSAALVRSWFNRGSLAQNSGTQTGATSSNSVVELGTAFRLSFLCFADDLVELTAIGNSAISNNSETDSQLMLDSALVGLLQGANINASQFVLMPFALGISESLADGLHVLSLAGRAGTGGTASFAAATQIVVSH